MDQTIYEVYQSKKAAVAEKLSGVIQQDNRLVLLCPLVFLAAVGFSLAYSFLSSQPVYLMAGGILIVVFLLLIAKHNRIKALLKYLELLIRINDTAIQRHDGQWPDFANTGERFVNHAHRYTADLNIFGRDSLFQYLNAATSFVGEDRLAHLLSFQTGPDEIKQRQQAIRELGTRLDWRQHFQATGLSDSIKKPDRLEKLLACIANRGQTGGRFRCLLP